VEDKKEIKWNTYVNLPRSVTKHGVLGSCGRDDGKY
jgi:hypothetical protein